MISGGEIQEFIPFGRNLLPFHPKHHYSSSFLRKEATFCCVETESSKDLFRALDAVSLQDCDSAEKWILRKCSSGEEELYTCDNVVVHSVSNGEGDSKLLKTFTLQSNVIQAVWCTFLDDEEDKPFNSICAIDNKNLEIYSDEGDYFPVGLPFQVSRLVSTQLGLLLERVPVPTETSQPSYPILFILTHPHKDIAPIIFKPIANSCSLTYLTTDSKLELVTLCEERNIAIFYHKLEGVHSVWRLRKATDEEISLVTDNISRVYSEPKSFIHVPSFLTNLRQSPLIYSNTSSPSRLANTTIKQSPASVSSPSGTQERSGSLSSIYFSPLRSSRLAASPVNTPIRNFSTPPNHKHTLDFNLHRTELLGSPLERMSTPRRSLFSIDYMDAYFEAPILPEMCFEHLWSEPYQTPSGGKTSSAFVTTDFMGQDYIAFLLSKQHHLKLIRFDPSNDGKRLIFGPLNIINAKHAVPIDSLMMICVLDSSNNIILYSGTYKVSLVHLPSLVSSVFHFSPNSKSSGNSFNQSVKRSSLISLYKPSSSPEIRPRFSLEAELSPMPLDVSHAYVFDSEMNLNLTSQRPITNILSIKDALGDRLTIETSEAYFRFSLPPLSSSCVVQMCLKGLKSVLPKDMGMQLLVKWYCLRNSPGPNEFTPVKEFQLFKYCLFSLLGYDVESISFSVDSLTNTTPTVAKKLKLESDEKGSDIDWEFLSKKTFSTKSQIENYKPVNSSSLLFPHLPSIFFSLHLILQEIQLHLLLKDLVVHMVELLYTLANDLNLPLYQDYFWRMKAKECGLINQMSCISTNDAAFFNYPNYFTPTPPCIYNYLQSIIVKKVDPFPFISDVTNQTRNLVLLFSCIQNEQFVESDVLSPINFGKNDREFEFKSSNFSIEERIVCCMGKLKMTQDDLKCIPPGLVLPLWNAIFQCKPDPPMTWSNDCYSLMGRTDLAALTGSKVPQYPVKVKGLLNLDSDEDGISSLNKEALSLLFPDDQRINDAYEMLQSSKPACITIQQKLGVSDHDFIEEQERHLYTLCMRTMALPVGRGMFTMRTYKPVVAKTFPIPKLCLTGRVPPRNYSVELTHIDVPSNMNTWPLFHNGVAAGLRVCPSASETIDSQWISFNKPKSNTVSLNDAQNEHAGFLFALGLNGHLARLTTMNIHDYLCKGNELTRVAILLGLATAKRGSMDISAVKILSIHVEAQLPSSSTELEVPPVVEVAAILGIGLIYQGSGHRHTTEVLLGEIGRPPGPEMEHYIDRESYALAAGLALGLVTLGKGNEMISTVSSAGGISMADELCNYMIGGHKKPLSAAQKERYKTPSYQIREGDQVNSDVTSPGATLALGLMFFNTNNHAVAQWVTAPDTQYLLESVRPDFLLLRTLAKGLILWDSIRPTKEWIDSHLPKIVAENALISDADINSRIDYETMSQAYCNIIAGACMALGLKYAGSADQEAFESINAYVNLFINLPDDQALAEQAGRATIEFCLNVLVVSLAMVMAGTGNVEVMRFCRYLRSRTSQGNVVLYGSHMASHMALGLLFLGGCRYTLSSSPESIAALICAFFPKYPIHSNDNRYHLQAFRHLYVLAVEPRLVIPMDIDTGKLVYAHLTLRYKNGKREKKRIRAPAILPELDLLEEIILDDERYWKVSFSKNKNWSNLRSFLSKNGILYVKQKVGCLPYQEDPEGYKSIYAQCVLKDAVHGWSYKPNTLRDFSSNPIVINYAKYLLTPRSEIKSESTFQLHLASLIFNCTFNETVDCLPSMLHFLKMMTESEKTSVFDLLQVRLLIHFVPYCKFVKIEFLEGLKSSINKRIKEVDKASLISYLRGEKPLSETNPSIDETLVFAQLPPHSSLNCIEAGRSSFTTVMYNLRQFNLPIASLLFLSEIFAK